MYIFFIKQATFNVFNLSQRSVFLTEREKIAFLDHFAIVILQIILLLEHPFRLLEQNFRQA